MNNRALAVRLVITRQKPPSPFGLKIHRPVRMSLARMT
jgi:hypothetical protein